jgi:hypothetical protein
MTGWRKRQVVEMAREAGFEQVGHDSFQEFTARIEAFAELVRKDYSTTHANIWLDRIHKFMLEEREACAKVCEERIEFWQRDDGRRYEDEYCAAAIRARGNT